MASDRRLPAHRAVTRVMRKLEAGDSTGARDILTGCDIDFTGTCALLEKSRLAGYFYILVRENDLVEVLPPLVVDELAAAYQRQVAKNKKNLALLVDLKKRLGDARVPFATLKGLYLAQRYFGDIRRRFMSDVDILVHPGDLEVALEAAAKMGLDPTGGADVDPRNPLWGIHAVEVRGEAGALDIHHAIRKLPNIEFDYTRIWNDTREFSIGDVTLLTLGDSDTLLVSAIGLGADIQNSHHNLRKIWDIYVMLRELDTALDWDRFFAHREREGSLKLVANVFAFCLLLLEAEHECPRLRQALRVHDRLLLIRSAAKAEQVFTRERQNLANRMLFSRLLPVSPLHYWLRWLLTLPVRVWHYRRPMPALS